MLFGNTRCSQLCHHSYSLSLQRSCVELSQRRRTSFTTSTTARATASTNGCESFGEKSRSSCLRRALFSSSSGSLSSLSSSSGHRSVGCSSSVLQREVRGFYLTRSRAQHSTWEGHQGKPSSVRNSRKLLQHHHDGQSKQSARKGRHRALDTNQEELSSDQIQHQTTTGKAFMGRLKVMTFNLLAPCYFRSDGVYESASMRKSLQRHRCIIGVLREQKCDVCCLQEFWFNDNLRNLYQEELGHLYFINTLQRTRSEDGVAILMLKEKFHIVNQHNILFREHSKFGHDRVALCVLAQLANHSPTPSGQGQEKSSSSHQSKSKTKTFSPPLAFVTSHLTYPHHTLDEYSRLEQSKVLLRKSKEFVDGSCPPNTPMIIAGDFNGTIEDQVCEEMRTSGYMDAFSQATGIQQDRITHCDHRKNQKGVDYIWLSHTHAGNDDEDSAVTGSSGQSSSSSHTVIHNRNPQEQSKLNMLPYEDDYLMALDTIEAYLLPRDIPCDTKMHRPKFRSPVTNSFDQPHSEGGVEGKAGGRNKLLAQGEMGNPGKLTLNSLDSYDDLDDDYSFASELDWKSWCNLSDHRPMVVHFDIYASEGRSE